MTAAIIDGRAVAAEVRARVARDVAAWVGAGHAQPGLATVLVGDDPASAVYIASKRRACVEVGIADLHRHLPAESSQEEAAALLELLAGDPAVSGVLLQLPVPGQLNGAELTALVPPEKDVDGLTPISAGRLAQGTPGLRPCTPRGVIELLDHHGVQIEGANAVVVGRSDLVGKPVAALLLERNATVTIAHSHTRELRAVCAQAEILIVATGVPKLIGADHVRPGAVVIDVGITPTDAGLVGDVDFEAVKAVASLIAPVPGGVGPMTIAMLLSNTLVAAELQAR